MAFSTGLSIVQGVQMSIEQTNKNEDLKGFKLIPATIANSTIAPVVSDTTTNRRWLGAADIALGVAALALSILAATGTLHLPLPPGVGTGLIVGGGISIGLALLSLAATKGREYIAET